MRPCNTQTWPMTREHFAAISARAAQHHLVLTGDRGTTSIHDCTFDWAYDGESFSITCTSHPFFVGCETIYEKLKENILCP